MNKIKQDIVDIYDASAECYGNEYRNKVGRHYFDKKVKNAMRLGDFGTGAKLLDVGCANGPYTIELACRGFQMVGLDLSACNVQIANQRALSMNLSNIEFVHGDAESIPDIPDDTFDGVISFSCVRYLEYPIKALQEMYRVVKPGGSVVVDFPNRTSPWFRGLKKIVKKGSLHPHDHQYCLTETLNMFLQAGFDNLRYSRFLYTYKYLPTVLYYPTLLFEIVGELPILDNLATIIMIRGVKPKLSTGLAFQSEESLKSEED